MLQIKAPNDNAKCIQHSVFFISLLNHNIPNGQNSLYMIFIDSGRVQYNFILPHLSAATSTVKNLYNFG